jgi:hypothetical protein
LKFGSYVYPYSDTICIENIKYEDGVYLLMNDIKINIVYTYYNKCTKITSMMVIVDDEEIIIGDIDEIYIIGITPKNK